MDLLHPLAILPIALIIIWIIWQRIRPNPLSYIPSPPGLPVLGNMLQINPQKPRLTFQKWALQYGGIYRVHSIAIGEVVVLSSYDTIHQALTVNGRAFSDRPNFFRMKYTIREMVSFRNNDASWRKLRKLSHSYMKQFGNGMSKLEAILHEVVDQMIADLEATNSSPVNIMRIVKQASFRSISVLLLGRVIDSHNPLLKMLMKFEKALVESMAPPRFDMVMLDRFPWLIHLPLSSSKELKAYVILHEDVWTILKQDQKHSAYDSLTKLLLTYVGDDASALADDRTSTLTDVEAGHTCHNIIVAGMATTSTAMYCIINTLAYRQDIQDKIHSEILKAFAATNSRSVSLTQKSMMSYLRATILETLRHFSVAPFGGVLHVTRKDTELKGYGAIPKGTTFIINTWSLHHEKALWGDPEKFRPERFLDEDGELLAADHPNRKHLLPFGAGPRVCIGEVFAMARLFMWTSTLVNKFVISRAAGYDPEWMNPDRHGDDSVLLRPLPCEVIFTPRVQHSY